MLLAISLVFFPILHAWAGLIRREETVKDAAHIARRLLIESSVGTMATSYPSNHPTLAGMPFSLQEYYASQNILSSPVHAASISVWHLPTPSAKQARVSLMGKVSVFVDDSDVDPSLRECYLKAHPDAKRWLPNEPDSPHLSLWARFDPMSVYFVGGFGDEHYIGEIPLRLYQDPLTDQSTPTPRQGSMIEDRLQVQES